MYASHTLTEWEVISITSEERHKARRQRREAARAAKRAAAIKPFDNYDKVISVKSLTRAAFLSRKGVRWKASVQRYMWSVLRHSINLKRSLSVGKSPVMGFICFDLCERGKLRHIRSVHFKERVVQRSLCDNALVPVLSRSLIYDNGASLQGKGIHFAVFRCRDHLRRYYRQHGTNKGYILQVDFKGYFDNIQHEPIKQMIIRNFSDRRIRWLAWQFVKSFGDKSVGIGSQVSQIFAVAYPNAIDHYAVEMLGLNLSARYMDDSYFIHESREYLQQCLEILEKKWNAMGIVLNPRKTQIIPLRKFTFLKVRFELTPSGRVIMRPCRESVTRQRRKLKKYRKFVDRGEMTLSDVRGSYESWRGYNRKLNGYRTLRNMDRLYYDLFGLRPSRKYMKKKKGRKS